MFSGANHSSSHSKTDNVLRTMGRRMNDGFPFGYPSDTHVEKAADDGAEHENEKTHRMKD